MENEKVECGDLKLADGNQASFHRRAQVEHASSIVRLVGPQKLGALINELCQNVGLEMHTVIRPFVQALCKVRRWSEPPW